MWCMDNALNCHVRDYIKCLKYVKEITWSNVGKTWIGFYWINVIWN